MFTGSLAVDVWCYIQKNGVSNVLNDCPSGVYESPVSTVVHLDSGDIVDVGDCGNPCSIKNYSTFIGFLLKAD